MHPQLSLLLEIQDLRSQKKELESTEMEEVQETHFHIDTDEAVRELGRKIDDLEEELEDRVRRRYERIEGSLDRVVAPVISGVCYGCFVSIPTATAADRDPNDEVQSCENCGRFIYILG